MALDYVAIGSRLRSARLKKKYTQEELSEKIGVSVAFLSRVERGTSHVNLKRLNEICDILQISESSVLNGVSTECDGYLNKEFNELLRKVSST